MMYCDKDGQMWVTSSSGLWCFDTKSRKFVKMGSNDGVLRDIVCGSVAEMKNGNIVIIRMEQAGRLIKDGKVNVTQVAYSVGFNDKSYFSTVFKQYYGVSPLEYSKK